MSRVLVGYDECRCILTQYCDGECRPVFADRSSRYGVSPTQGVLIDAVETFLFEYRKAYGNHGKGGIRANAPMKDAAAALALAASMGGGRK